MTVPDLRPFRNPTNLDILGAIRRNASPDYQRRIPEATKANINDVINDLLSYRPTLNEFLEALVNRIGTEIVRYNNWTNPWSKFKRGMLKYGDTIEEINVGLIKAKRYDADRESLERDLFGQHRPDVQTSFHKVNRQDFYPITINEAMLRRAFMDESGLSGFVTALLTAPQTSDNYDEFLLMSSLFGEYYRANGFFKVQVGDVASMGSDSADAKYMIRRTRELAGNLAFPNTYYNASGMPVAATADELELFITPEANAAIDVEALAGAFNIDKSQMSGRINLIPQVDMGIYGAQAILTTRDFFVVADSLLETTSQYNPAGLTQNFFLHHHQIVSASRFVPAILFTTEAGDVITIPVTPVTSVAAIVVTNAAGDTVTDVIRGLIYNAFTTAVTTPAGGDNDAVRYEVVSNTAGQTLSVRTYITQTGMLHVGFDEQADSIIVQAIAVDNNSILATATLDVDGDILYLWPDPGVESDSDDDSLEEVTPEDLTVDAEDNVLIPNVRGVQYLMDAVNVPNLSVQHITASTAFTAVARAGKELAAGATAAWTLEPNA